MGAAALTAASAAVGALVKQSIDGYGEYEQLVGGVETLFKSSADAVMNYANNAYKSAGLSANQYMETVTGFAASLLQSLGGDTEAAADKADLALTDMADNANKMGTAMESIQNAYQGFAKQNYTMLDNLKLGYGGTKEEMERLLADAEKLSGIHYDISSYADIVDAIHVVQTEMGITGTTAKEASSTIQGSVNATKAAWTNLVAGMANENADMDALMSDLVESAGTAAENIVPRIQTVLKNVGGLLPEVARTVGREAPGAIAEAAPAMIEAGGSLILGLAEGVMEAAPELWESAKEAAGAALEEFDPEEALEAGGRLIGKVAKGAVKAVPWVNEAIGNIVKAMWDGFWETDWLELGRNLINGMIEGFTGEEEAISKEALEMGKDIVRGLINGVTGGLPEIAKALRDLASEGLAAMKEKLGIHSPSAVFRDEIGENIGLGVAEGISDSSSKAVKAADKLAKDVYKRSADWADKQTKYMELSYDEQIELWETIQGQLSPPASSIPTPRRKSLTCGKRRRRNT